jgi:proline dehydrogenase
MFDMSRWTVDSVKDALTRCKQRNSEGISCTLHLLDEYVQEEEAARELATAYSALIETLAQEKISGGISVKLTSLGALVDQKLAGTLVQGLAREAHGQKVEFEIDMEGRGLVEFTLRTAISVKKQGLPVVLALQANLDRSRDDLRLLQEEGVIPRLVKGAYPGDVSEFEPIENRFKDLAGLLLEEQSPFHVGTHDSSLLSWLQERLGNRRTLVRFGFLMGLSDFTKQSMAGEGWAVSEYIPIGEEGKAYIARREQYLTELRKLERDPAP